MSEGEFSECCEDLGNDFGIEMVTRIETLVRDYEELIDPVAIAEEI